MPNFTPGPWIGRSIGPDEDRDECFVLWPKNVNITNRHNRIADVKGQDNACLVEAAPDLYDALKAMRESYVGTEDMLGPSMKAKVAAMDAALAKAEVKS